MRFNIALAGLVASAVAQTVDMNQVSSSITQTTEQANSIITSLVIILTVDIAEVKKILSDVLGDLLGLVNILHGGMEQLPTVEGAQLSAQDVEQLSASLKEVDATFASLDSLLNQISVDLENPANQNLTIGTQAESVQAAALAYGDALLSFSETIDCSSCSTDDMNSLHGNIEGVNGELNSLATVGF